MKRTLAALSFATLTVAMHGELAAGSLAVADAALQSGEADKALALLYSAPDSPAQHNLKCRVFLTLEEWDRALRECRQAILMEEGNSGYHMWLARVLGEKASRAPFTSAFSLAKEVRMEFETAVRLDESNADALADLGEFYKDAPGIVGGGDSKAEDIAARLEKVDPARGHQLRGWIAEAHKDFGAAEQELKAAIGVDPHPAFAWMSLASFYRRRQRWDEMDAALQSGATAAQRDRQAGEALYNGAQALIKANRNLPMAAKMMEGYLDSPSKTERAPAFAAHIGLARILLKLGNTSEARDQRAAALALAHEYKPAVDLKI